MNRRKLKIALAIIISFLIVPIKTYAINEKIHKNIYIENIDISKLTKGEAIDKVKENIDKNKNLILCHNQGKLYLKFDEIDLSYNIEETVEKAFNIGRDKQLIDNTKTKLKLTLGKKLNLNLEAKYNDKKIDKYISDISNNININPVDSVIKIENEDIKLIHEKDGVYVKEDILKKLIIEKVRDINFTELSIPVEIIKPKYTFEKLSKINSILGSYETEFNPKNYNRTSNIGLATSKIDNILIDTGEEFSFNELTGKRNKQDGFKEAPIIINGKMEKGVGGGICQVSSTIYNAALYSGVEIIQARNHSIPSAYIQKGRDATVSYGTVDLKFKNTYDHPILINNRIENNKIISTIYGNYSYKKNIEIITEQAGTIPNKIIVRENKNMYEGEKYIKEVGRKGYKVKTYRVYKDSKGSILDKELINESYYPPMNKVIIKGVKPKTNGFII